jgi:hypothetical protein
MILVETLSGVIDSSLTITEIKETISAIPNLPYVLFPLANKSFRLDSSVISFGPNNQVGDISIQGNIAGGDITIITINYNNYYLGKPSVKVQKKKIPGQTTPLSSISTPPKWKATFFRLLASLLILSIGVWVGVSLLSPFTRPIIYLSITAEPTSNETPRTSEADSLQTSPYPLPTELIEAFSKMVYCVLMR